MHERTNKCLCVCVCVCVCGYLLLSANFNPSASLHIHTHTQTHRHTASLFCCVTCRGPVQIVDSAIGQRMLLSLVRLDTLLFSFGGFFVCVGCFAASDGWRRFRQQCLLDIENRLGSVQHAVWYGPRPASGRQGKESRVQTSKTHTHTVRKKGREGRMQECVGE